MWACGFVSVVARVRLLCVSFGSVLCVCDVAWCCCVVRENCVAREILCVCLALGVLVFLSAGFCVKNPAPLLCWPMLAFIRLGFPELRPGSCSLGRRTSGFCCWIGMRTCSLFRIGINSWLPACVVDWDRLTLFFGFLIFKLNKKESDLL